MVLDDIAGGTCAWNSFLDAVQVATTARIMHQSYMRLYYTAILNLVQDVGMFNRPLLKAATHHLLPIL